MALVDTIIPNHHNQSDNKQTPFINERTCIYLSIYLAGKTSPLLGN